MKNYPPHPGSNWDHAVKETARQALRSPNKVICIYCHAQAKIAPVNHKDDCPAKNDKPKP